MDAHVGLPAPVANKPRYPDSLRKPWVEWNTEVSSGDNIVE